MTDDLAAAIADCPKLVALYAHWRKLKGDRAMPSPAQFDILELRPLAGYLHVIDVVREGRRRRYRHRVYATEVAQRIGADYTGKLVDEIPNSTWASRITESLDEVVKAKAPRVSSIDLFLPRGHVAFRRLGCPMSFEGVEVDRIYVGLAPLTR